MIAGVEGLALLPLLPLVWMAIPLLALGACFVLSGCVALFWQRSLGARLLKIGAAIAAPGVVLLALFVAIAIKMKHDSEWTPPPVKTDSAVQQGRLRVTEARELP
jgi:hypothetical protein